MNEMTITSRRMKAVKRENTTPELVVRRLLHRMGLRFRINQRSLPGSPDIVLRKHRTVIFVHGCFWHRHAGCRFASIPKTRQEFWTPKFIANMARDVKNVTNLEAKGWRVLVVWECETKNLAALEERLMFSFSLNAQSS